ncbi:MAG: guanylate kinase [Candidatus Peribacteraceae bacterium]
MHTGKLVLLIGPSGVGKSVILRTLRESHADLVFPRSATTRARRPGEGDQLYHFIAEVEFDEKIAASAFLEYATVHQGARYGTLLSEILPKIDEGKTVVREVDVQGFESIRKHPLFQKGGKYTLQTIFILPESTDQLLAHIQKRAPMEKDELMRRLKSMEHELSVAPETDVQVVNAEGKLDETIAAVEEAMGF